MIVSLRLDPQPPTEHSSDGGWESRVTETREARVAHWVADAGNQAPSTLDKGISIGNIPKASQHRTHRQLNPSREEGSKPNHKEDDESLPIRAPTRNVHSLPDKLSQSVAVSSLQIPRIGTNHAVNGPDWLSNVQSLRADEIDKKAQEIRGDEPNPNSRQDLNQIPTRSTTTAPNTSSKLVERLHQWRATLQDDYSTPPPDPTSPFSQQPEIPSHGEIQEPEADREGSDNEQPQPVVAYYSDDDDDKSIPDLSVGKSSVSEEDIPSEPVPALDVQTVAKPPPVPDASVPPSNAEVVDRIKAHSPVRRGRRYGPGSNEKWWKREPHPVYSARFASQRLLVE